MILHRFSEEKINAFLPYLDEAIKGGLVTLERVRVIGYRSGEAPPDSSPTE
jgi:PII-like signaling protein